MTWLNILGWTATATFAISYFFKRAAVLRATQAAAAVLWVAYGIGIRSAPVVAANMIVCLAAVFTLLHLARRRQGEHHGAKPVESD